MKQPTVHTDDEQCEVQAADMGHWGADYGGNVSDVTNENGFVPFRIEWVAQRSTVSFTIDKVIIDGKEYNFTGKKPPQLELRQYARNITCFIEARISLIKKR